jgi:hypothetical protein
MNKLGLILVALTAAGCDVSFDFSEGDGLAGVRLRYGCPTGETCSDGAPNGLRARSRSLDETPYITAVGGVQTFDILLPDSAPFDLAFVVDSDNPAIEVVDVAPGQLAIRGITAGEANVTLREASTGDVYDRFFLTSKRVADVFLRPAPTGLFVKVPGAVFVGYQSDIDAQLNSPDTEDGLIGKIHEPVADESAQLLVGLGDPGLFALQARDWNTAQLTVGPNPGVGTIVVRTGFGATHTQEIVVVDRIDEIMVLEPSSVTVGQPFSVCALVGSDDGGLVLGAPLTYQLTGPAEFLPEIEGCIEVTVTGSAPVDLTISGPGATETVSLTATE